MNREKIVEMAAAAGFPDVQPENHQFVASGDLREAHEQFLVTLEAFASLVAAHEREAADKDAQRYQWIVENAVISTDDFRHDGKDPASTKQPLDNAIDAAIRGRKP